MRGSERIMEKKPMVTPGFTDSRERECVIEIRVYTHARTFYVDSTVTNASPFAFPALPAWLEYAESSLYTA